MNERFTVRLRSLNGESLTGYLMRMGIRNGRSVNSILYLLNVRGQQCAHIDILPRRIINTEDLGYLLGLDVIMVENLTFTNIYKKFGLDIAKEAENYRSVMNEEIVKDKRKFCVSCLKEHGIYKLLWQVKEIEVCDKHLTQLKATCDKCNKEQPYISESLAKMTCSKCNASLLEQEEIVEKNNTILIQQLGYYKDWNMLIDANKNLFPIINSLSDSKARAIALYYLGTRTKYNWKKDLDASFLSKNYRLKVDKAINESSISTIITLKQLINTLRNLNIDIETFSRLLIPKEFVDNTLSELRRKLGPCLSPWCASFGTNDSMVEVGAHKFYESHYMSSICRECYMKFGYRKSDYYWEELDNNIDFIWNTVLPKIKDGQKYTQIVKSIGNNTQKLNYAIGYLVNHNLLSRSYFHSEIPEIKTDDLLVCFRKLNIERGERYTTAKRIYNWGGRAFGLYYTTKEIQDYFIFHAYKERFEDGCVRSNKGIYFNEKIVQAIEHCKSNKLEINIKNISKVTSIGINTLHRYNTISLINCEKHIQLPQKLTSEEQDIKNQIELFIEKDISSREITECEEFCKKAGISYKRIWRIFPNIKNDIQKKIKLNIDIMKNERERMYALIVLEAIEELINYGVNISPNRVSEHLNIKQETLMKYPSIKDILKEVRVQGCFNRKKAMQRIELINDYIN
jgi:hypothetical protein